MPTQSLQKTKKTHSNHHQNHLNLKEEKPNPRPNHIRGLSLSTDLSYGRTYFRAWGTSGTILTLKEKIWQVLRAPRMFCCLLEKLSCPQGHNLSLSQLVLGVPDHIQDSNEPRVLFKGEGRKLSVSMCYKQHPAELQVSWQSAEDLLLHTKTQRWGSRVKNSPPKGMVAAGTVCSGSSIKGLCSKGI